MKRGSWSELSQDSDIWKKMLAGAVCMLTVLPIPIALGALHTDLESEVERIKEGRDGEDRIFPGFHDPATLLGRGLAPAFVFMLVVMLFCLPTVVVMLFTLWAYAGLSGEHGVNMVSLLITVTFGLVALVVQFFCALLFPIALAQYARGMNIKPAIDPLANLSYIAQMGAPYWSKAAGWWLFLLGFAVLYIYSPNLWIGLAIQFTLATVGFISLVVSSRYALRELQMKL